MTLRVFSVVGEALGFGARRMATIMRVAWLPVALLLIVEMATVFGYLSVAAERLITFSDVATFAQAKTALARLSMIGWKSHPDRMWMVNLASGAINTVLIASFMAPLIRYAGLGEKPAPGVVRLEFGPDQIRYILAALISSLVLLIFILAPMAGAAFYTIKYLSAALSQTYASFPNPDSLHTMELVTKREALAAQGGLWVYDIAVPLAVAAPFVIGFWVLLVAHFHPRNRASTAGAPNLVFRALTILLTLAVIGGLVWWGFHAKASAWASFAHYPALLFLAGLIVLYFNLRVLPYQGVAVCRRSMAPAGTLKVTRGWNVLRLFAVIVMIAVIMFVMLIAINMFLFGFVAAVANLLYQATASATKLANSGVEAEWVRPLWIWVWNGFKISVNIFWAFFSYGVTAGLLGRLYRESEREGA